LFEVEGVVGAGWGHNYNNHDFGGDANYFTSKFGFNFNFNVGEKKAWTIAVKPSIVYNMEADRKQSYNAYNVNNSAIDESK
jgi:OmpA-OmpF porin, OOP family